MSEEALWTEAAALLEEHRTEEALYLHITEQLRPLLAADDHAAVKRWYRIVWMIEQLEAGATGSSSPKPH